MNKLIDDALRKREEIEAGIYRYPDDDDFTIARGGGGEEEDRQPFGG